MIIVTGAAGFIGSCFLAYLLETGESEIIAVDEFNREDKEPNYIRKEGILRIHRKELFQFISTYKAKIKFVIHLGARTDTVDQNKEIFNDLNIEYSKKVWALCSDLNMPLIYASSAATYGNGEFGFDDELDNLKVLKPMNEYGRSKQIVDLWALNNDKKPPYWIGLKFFNVFGPNEYHKDRMASVIFHSFKQIEKTGKMNLFRSHRKEFEDGEQKRDFIYVKDVCKTIQYLMENRIESGIYNLGTGKARTFNDLVRAVFAAMDLKSNIEYINIPQDIRENYQYFTEAKMGKLANEDVPLHFYTLEEGVKDYVQGYLKTDQYL